MAPRFSYGEYLTSPQHFVSVVARLKAGVTLEHANAELHGIGGRLADEPRRPDAVWSAVALPATEARVDSTARRSVLLLFSASASAAAMLLLSAAVNRCTPFTGCARTILTFTDRDNDGNAPVIGRHYISTNYFELLGIPLREGRRMTASDLQFAYPDTMVVVKSRSSATALEPALRAAVAAADPLVPLYDVMTLDERVAHAMGRPRFNSAILSMFAVAAALLAGLGIYGVCVCWPWRPPRRCSRRDEPLLLIRW